MITDKQKLIAEQAIYGDLQMLCYDKVHEVMNKCAYVYGEDDRVKVIVRPLSDLTKPITQKGYNNDEPFVPMMVLAKLAHGDETREDLEIIDGKITIGMGVYFGFDDGVFAWYEEYHYCGAPNQVPLYDLLHTWHFDTRGLIEKGEAVSTEQYDVYSVKGGE